MLLDMLNGPGINVGATKVGVSAVGSAEMTFGIGEQLTLKNINA